MEKVKYKVTTAFGMSPIGEMRDAFLVHQDGHLGLIWHPKDVGGCASLEMCEVKGSLPYWVSSKEPYVNVENQRDLTKVAKALSAVRYSPNRKARRKV
jgi:hypothetical protein